MKGAGTSTIRRDSGFTIVELLIVVVVIAIIAAISIVSFVGIQDRAARTQTTTAVSSYIKGLMLYASEKGVYPDFKNACLGGALNTNNRCYKVNDEAATCTGSGSAYGQVAFDNAMKPYMGGALALPSQATYDCGGGRFAGALYYASTPKTGVFVFAINKASVGPCPDIAGTSKAATNTQDEVVICRYLLPDL